MDVFYWDENNRLRVVSNMTQDMQHYIYDASGERMLKANSLSSSVYENGSLTNPPAITFSSYTTYPSAYLVIDPNGIYSKHYYAGSQCIVSRLGSRTAQIFNYSSGAGSALSSEGSQEFNKQNCRRPRLPTCNSILIQIIWVLLVSMNIRNLPTSRKNW